MANVVAQARSPARDGSACCPRGDRLRRPEDEARRLATLLRTSRLMTVVGPGGGQDPARPARRGGGRGRPVGTASGLVDLGGTDDPGQVASAVAAALGMPAATRRAAPRPWPPAPPELLLILDTCEHLVDACAFADTVLRGAPGVTLIVTSRQPLDVPGEHAFPLLPLPRPTRSNCSPSARRPSSPGSASRRQPGGHRAVCRRLDGIPLAIEFAAVRLRALPLPELTTRWSPASGADGQPPRHQPQAPDAACRDRLELPAVRPGRADAMERLSVFAGTFDVAAPSTCARTRAAPPAGRPRACRPRRQVRGAAGPRGGGGPRRRYRLLGALREFGADRLAETGGETRA